MSNDYGRDFCEEARKEFFYILNIFCIANVEDFTIQNMDYFYKTYKEVIYYDGDKYINNVKFKLFYTKKGPYRSYLLNKYNTYFIGDIVAQKEERDFISKYYPGLFE